MTACEKCWADAYGRMLAEPSKSQTEHYMDLLAERKEHPCTPAEQHGGWMTEPWPTPSTRGGDA